MHAGADRRNTKGKKELLGFQTGVRESPQSWRDLLIDIKLRGLEVARAVGDGGLGFWTIEQVFPSTRHQRCWVHKTANVLNKVALSVQVNMKIDLREICGAPTRAAAEAATDLSPTNTMPSTTRRSFVCPRKRCSLFLLPRRALGPSAHIKSDQLKTTHLKYAVSPISLEGLFARLFARGGYWRAHVSCCLT